MVDDEQLLRTLKEVIFPVNCESIPNPLLTSIFRVPIVLRKEDHNSPRYPLVVSVGSYHNDKGKELKITYVRSLLQLSGSQQYYDTLEACVRNVIESIHRIRSCYVQTEFDLHHDDSVFVRMMVIDGCFVLGFLNSEMEQNETSDGTNSKREENNFVTVNILKDLLLLENQIPFFVLKDIFELTILKSEQCASLTEHIKRLLKFGHSCLFIGDLRIPKDLAVTTTDDDHILSLLHKCYKPEEECDKSSIISEIYNATEFEKVRASFKPNGDAGWPMAIEVKCSRAFPWFWVNPTLKIPKLNIHVNTEAFLHNIIAYEHTSKADRYFTSFVTAIDDLVDSSCDIAKLV